MRKKKLAMVLAAALALFMCMDCVSVSAKTLSEINKDIKSKKAELEQQMDESKDLSDQIRSMEKEITSTENSIDRLDSAISDAQQELVVLEKDLDEAKEKVNKQNEDLSARLRTMYKNGTVGFVDVLLQSGSFSDFLSNLTLVQKVFESDKSVLTELQKSHDLIEEKANEVKTLKNELTESRTLAEETKASLSSQKSVLDDKKKEVNKDIAQIQKDLDRMEAEAEALSSQIRDQGSSSNTSTYNGVMCWPAPSYTRISCPFGWRIHPITGRKNYHGGVDLAAPGGSSILAADSGTVIIASYHYSYGNYVVIDHGGGISTLYAHSRKRLVSKGQKVSRGQKIALVGTTGSSTGNHLHFEVRKNGTRINPLPYIQ